jgi:hypothetical protein
VEVRLDALQDHEAGAQGWQLARPATDEARDYSASGRPEPAQRPVGSGAPRAGIQRAEAALTHRQARTVWIVDVLPAPSAAPPADDMTDPRGSGGGIFQVGHAAGS